MMGGQFHLLYLADIRFPLERANGIQTMHTCHALAARGHAVVLGVRQDSHGVALNPFDFYGLPPCDRLTWVRAGRRGGPAVRRLTYLAHALCWARQTRYDVVFTRDLTVADLLLRWPGFLRPPVVYEAHTFAPEAAATMPDLTTGAAPAAPAKQRRLLERERRVWRLAEGYVTTTGVLADELALRFGARWTTATIPNGGPVSVDRFAFTCPGPTPIVAYAGQLYPWKGGDVFLRALMQLPGVRGLVIGGLEFERDLQETKRRARAYGVEDRLTFTGMTETAMVQARLREADVLVLPTIATPTARYSSPLKLFEYLAAGKPIVASDLPSIREIVRDGVHAHLVAPGDPGALADGLCGGCSRTQCWQSDWPDRRSNWHPNGPGAGELKGLNDSWPGWWCNNDELVFLGRPAARRRRRRRGQPVRA